MKGIIGLALAAAVSGVVAQPHNHHGHHHAKKHTHGAVDKRADAVAGTVVVTKVVQGPTVVEYVLDGKKVPAKEAEQGIKEGGYVVLGSSKPSFVAPPPVVSTSIASVPGGAQFFAKTSSTSTSTSTSSSTTSSIPTTSSSPIPSSTSSEPPASTSSAASDENITGGGLDSKFPSGKIRCDHFPSDFGALYVDWVGLAGWTTLAKVPGGRLMKGVAINNYEQPITGPCQPGMLCSYACPPGYQKTQWPEENQGATGQSIGGLYCNTDGYLELTRESHPTLCEPGAGGVYVKNLLPKSAAICRTDYPGNEAMVIPLETNPGGQYPLTNPVSSSYYKWKGQATTAQYYVNNMGIPVDDACTWNSKTCPDCAGNWAPVNLGVGKSDDGITYISIFPNAPTTTALLNFDMEIKGDISGECWLKNGQYSGNNGCTVGLREGGTATVILKPRGA